MLTRHDSGTFSPPGPDPPETTSGTQLAVLHGFELRHDGRAVRVPLSAQRILAFLALQERPVRRLFVAGNLWTDASEHCANASLRTALWRLSDASCPLVRASNGSLALDPEVAVDFRQVTATARGLLENRNDGLDVRAGMLLAGDLLPDWYDDWVLIERERFRQLRLHALEALCEDLMNAGRYAEAIDVGLAAVAGEPLRESAHRLLIRVHLAEGNRGEAMQHFRTYRTRLLAELGFEPGPEIQALVAAVSIW